MEHGVGQGRRSIVKQPLGLCDGWIITCHRITITCLCFSSSLSLFKWQCFVSTLGAILNYMCIKKTLLWIIYMIETRYRSLKKIHRTGVEVLHCPGRVLTSNLRCLDIFTSTQLLLLPIAGVAKNLGSSSLLSSFAGVEAGRRGMQLALLHSELDYLTYNWTSRHGTGYTFTWPRPTVEPVWLRKVKNIRNEFDNFHTCHKMEVTILLAISSNLRWCDSGFGWLIEAEWRRYAPVN